MLYVLSFVPLVTVPSLKAVVTTVRACTCPSSRGRTGGWTGFTPGRINEGQ